MTNANIFPPKAEITNSYVTRMQNKITSLIDEAMKSNNIGKTRRLTLRAERFSNNLKFVQG